MDGAVLGCAQRAHFLGRGTEFQRAVDVRGAAALWVPGVELQHVRRADRQVEAPQAAVTPGEEKKRDVNVKHDKTIRTVSINVFIDDDDDD